MFWALVCVVWWLGIPFSVMAAPVFHWVDAKGNLHATDRLQEVPEPYRSTYAAQLKELEARAASDEPKQKSAEAPAGAAKSMPSQTRPSEKKAPKATSTGSILTAEAQAQARWRARVEAARKELLAATQALRALEEEIGQLQMNPILRHTPMVKAQVAQREAGLEQARQRVSVAQTMLLKTIPEQARREGVPPGWIQ